MNPVEGKYKLLDCNRQDILGLPSGAVHLWLAYYMNESEGGESWLSLRKIELKTGMSQPTIIKWQRYLKEHGWLVETGETAADKYTKATRGAHSVPVVRVDDPKRGAKDSLAPESPVTLDNGVAKKSLAPKNFSEGSCFGSGCGSACESGSSSSTTSVEVTADATSKSTPQTNTKTNSKSKTCRKCGEPLYPDKNHTCKAGAFPLAALTPAEGFSPSCTSSGDNVAAQAPQVPPPPAADFYDPADDAKRTPCRGKERFNCGAAMMPDHWRDIDGWCPSCMCERYKLGEAPCHNEDLAKYLGVPYVAKQVTVAV